MLMRELGKKEIINLRDGSSLGYMDKADIIVNEKTGRVEGILIADTGCMFDFSSAGREVWIPWESIKKIGNDLILVDYKPETGRV